MKITANLIVPSIEACLSFYVDRLGFARRVEVPEGDVLGFVILEKDGAELMLQSEHSLASDVAEVESRGYKTALFVEVPSLDAIARALAGYERIAVAERTTFYGTREMIVSDPAGNPVVFAERK